MTSTTDELDLRDAFRTAAKRWPVVLGTALIFAVVGVLYTAIVKPVYQAKATLYFPSRSSGLSLLGLGGDTASSNLGAALLGQASGTPIKVFRAFLESERTMTTLKTSTNLSRKQIEDMRRFDEQQAANTLSISAEDEDPKLALKVVQLHISSLRAINRDVSLDPMADDAKVVQKKLDDHKKTLADIEEQYRQFQLKQVSAPSVVSSQGQGIVATGTHWYEMLKELELQRTKIDAALSSVTQRLAKDSTAGSKLPNNLPGDEKLRETLKTAQLELLVREQDQGPDLPAVKELKAKIKVLQDQIAAMAKEYYQSVAAGNLDPTEPIGSSGSASEYSGLVARKAAVEAQLAAVHTMVHVAPGESIELTRLLRQIGLETSLVQQLSLQAEAGKLQALRDPNKWNILDEPQIAELPVNKHYTRMAILTGIVGLFVGMLLALRQAGRAA
ncbi:MAG: hypothetical protein JSS72_11680 [Armatimonadetes bacterium]|nr:hypothetical protein [Armatimonadota bacterium]